MKILEQYHPQIGAEEQTDRISVIVSVYNIADYVRRSIDSVREQTYRNLEIIIVDDGSTDGSGALCDQIATEDERVKVIHKEQGGPADARNAGLAVAGGSYIGFVDGDDWIDPDMYEKMLAAMKEQGADIGICRYRQVHRDYTADESRDRSVVFEGKEVLRYYVQETKEYAIQNAVWNKLYKKKILAGLLFPVGKWYEDIMFTTRALSRAERCIYLDTSCYNYIIDREGSIMNTQIGPRIFTDLIPTYYEKTAFLEALGCPELAVVHDYHFFRRLLLFYHQIEESEITDKEKYLARLTQIIKDNQERCAAAFGCPVADPRDYRKMQIFFKSPARYSRRIRLEEQVIIPLKSRLKHILRS